MKKSTTTMIYVSVAAQRLRLEIDAKIVREFPISTSAFGLGFKEGSRKTPVGRFRIARKIGAGSPRGTVFQSRKAVPASKKFPRDADLILSRILWLEGLGARNANTFERYIYLHGTNHEGKIGQPASHGCIRMRNADVIELFDLVAVGTPVRIVRGAGRKRPRSKAEKSVAPAGVTA